MNSQNVNKRILDAGPDPWYNSLMHKKIKPHARLDTRGLLCPLPIIEAAKKIKKLRSSAILLIISDDWGILEDLPAWCRSTQNELLSLIEDDEIYYGYVMKK